MAEEGSGPVTRAGWLSEHNSRWLCTFETESELAGDDFM